ncbi:MAG: HNH endonuclease [Flavobacteriales bacterium]|nr:HNH endonuclease [Flavobacteriales bacterium]
MKHFNAVSGACSPVTDREATGDKSVTIDKHEKSVLKTCYSLNSFTRAGGALPDGKPSHFNFNVISFKNNKLSYEQHELAIKYPKSNKDELRLYFNRESTFYPPTDSTWFIFTKQGDPTPYIGFMKTSEWGNIGVDKTTKEVYEHDYLFDGDDDNYQKSIAEPIEDTDDELADIADEEPKLATSKQRGSVSRHHRKAKLAKKAFRAADYKCQFNKDHRTFISGATKKPYIEAHHLVPVSLNGTDEFEYELDVVENIIPLCPMCHRAIHFGDTGTKKELLQKFIKERQDKLKKKKINITFERLLQIYGAD